MRTGSFPCPDVCRWAPSGMALVHDHADRSNDGDVQTGGTRPCDRPPQAPGPSRHEHGQCLDAHRPSATSSRCFTAVGSDSPRPRRSCQCPRRWDIRRIRRPAPGAGAELGLSAQRRRQRIGSCTSASTGHGTRRTGGPRVLGGTTPRAAGRLRGTASWGARAPDIDSHAPPWWYPDMESLDILKTGTKAWVASTRRRSRCSREGC